MCKKSTSKSSLVMAAACYLRPKKRFIFQVINLVGNLRPVLGLYNYYRYYLLKSLKSVVHKLYCILNLTLCDGGNLARNGEWCVCVWSYGHCANCLWRIYRLYNIRKPITIFLKILNSLPMFGLNVQIVYKERQMHVKLFTRNLIYKIF